MPDTPNHRIVSHEDWIAERKALPAKENRGTQIDVPHPNCIAPFGQAVHLSEPAKSASDSSGCNCAQA